MKTKIFAIVSCAVLLPAAGCKDKNQPGSSQAEPITGSVETPAWADLLQNDDVLGSYAEPYTPEFIVSVK